MIIWLTGLPCSGKTTIAKAVAADLNSGLDSLWAGRICELLDGDDLRGSDFANGIGFDRDARKKHLLRVGYMAYRLSRHVPYVICAFVSPFEDVRQQLPIDLLVYVKCRPEACAKRDTKGMWAKAKRGEIQGFTGYDAPYEEPLAPHVTVNTETTSLRRCAKAVRKAMERWK